MKKKEEWRDVDGYEGYYEVSNLGRVRSLRISHKCKTPPYILTEFGHSSGYRRVRFWDVVKYVHVLVATAFIEKCASVDKLEVNHKDTNKSNNRVDNLEWITHAENMIHAGLHKCWSKKTIRKLEDVWQERSGTSATG